MKITSSNGLQGARNIGPTILKRLNEIGICSLVDLAELTPVNTYKKLCEQNPDSVFPVCYYLYSLEGALLDLHWDELPEDLKKNLRKQVGR